MAAKPERQHPIRPAVRDRHSAAVAASRRQRRPGSGGAAPGLAGAAGQAAGAARQSPGRDATGADEPGVVLVADDDPGVRLLAEESLRNAGFEVLLAEDGAAALAALERCEADLILCDVMMPKLDGFGLCQRVRQTERWAHIPVLMLTGLDDVESIERAFSAGATDFAVKPINWGLLPHRARYVLRSSRAMQQLHTSEERYSLAARGANDGLWDWDLVGNQVHYSARWKAMIGCDESAIGDRPEEWLDRIHADDRTQVRGAMDSHLGGRSDQLEVEYRLQMPDGGYEWMHARGVALFDAEGKPYRMAGSQTNITKRKEAEEKLLFDAFHDSLTQLPNRALFLDRLDHSIQLSERRHNYQFAVVFIDLDRFKVVNDSLGHLVGDLLLIEVANRIVKTLRVGDTLARLGGDEFTILCEEIQDATSVTRLVKRISASLAQPIQLGDQQVFTSASMGIAISATGYERPEDMLRDADAAMYRAKARGGGVYEVFDAEMHMQAVNTLTLESDLRNAVADQAFTLHYQPIVDIQSGQVRGFEALIRWQHPTRGLLLPDEFLPLAEESRLIVPIGQWVLGEACRQLARWQARWERASGWFMSVNISSCELAQEDLLANVQSAIAESGIEPANLKLEITESSLIKNGERALATMRALKAEGVQLSIDDFGTGYSSFNYLHKFPFDILKIDGTFIRQFDQDAERREIVETIISLAHSLGLQVVAEGSETAQDFAALERTFCEYAQGHSIRRPASGFEITTYLAEAMGDDNATRARVDTAGSALEGEQG